MLVVEAMLPDDRLISGVFMTSISPTYIELKSAKLNTWPLPEAICRPSTSTSLNEPPKPSTLTPCTRPVAVGAPAALE